MNIETDVTPTAATRPARQRIRAISTTVGFVIINALLIFAMSYLLTVVALPALNSGDSGANYGGPYYSVSIQILFFELLLPIAPAAASGMYWLALRGLQRQRLRFVLLEVTGVGVALLLVTGVFTNVIDIAVNRFVKYNDTYFAHERLSIMLQAMAQSPIIVLLLIIWALGFAVVIVNFARLFTKHRLLNVTPPHQGRRDFALVWGLTTFIIIVYSISNILMTEYLASIIDTNGQLRTLGVFGFILLVYYFIPTGIVAAIACVDGLRLLHNSPAIAASMPPKEDPFASSDGSFMLSYGSITDND